MNNKNNYFLYRIATTFTIMLVCFLFGFFINSKTKLENIENIQTEEVINEEIQFADSLKQFIKQLNLQHSDIVYAQAVLESNHFKSLLFKENNNLFGMKEPMVRNTVALGTKNGYAYYKNWQHSVIDYALYQSSYFFNNNRTLSRQDYLEKLARSYAEDPKYINKINNLSNKNK